MKEYFGAYIKEATELIHTQDFELAKEYIKKAMIIKEDAPEPHNLLGILAEYDSDEALACKHYRAACALEPTYEAANNNLSRLTGNHRTSMWHQFDFGVSKGFLEKEEIKRCL